MRRPVQVPERVDPRAPSRRRKPRVPPGGLEQRRVVAVPGLEQLVHQQRSPGHLRAVSACVALRTG